MASGAAAFIFGGYGSHLLLLDHTSCSQPVAMVIAILLGVVAAGLAMYFQVG